MLDSTGHLKDLVPLLAENVQLLGLSDTLGKDTLRTGLRGMSSLEIGTCTPTIEHSIGVQRKAMPSSRAYICDAFILK
jgi:hypothetical protein